MVGFCLVGQSPMEFEALPEDAFPNPRSSAGRSRGSYTAQGYAVDDDYRFVRPTGPSAIR